MFQGSSSAMRLIGCEIPAAGECGQPCPTVGSSHPLSTQDPFVGPHLMKGNGRFVSLDSHPLGITTGPYQSPFGVQMPCRGALASNWRPNRSRLSLLFSVHTACK